MLKYRIFNNSLNYLIRIQKRNQHGWTPPQGHNTGIKIYNRVTKKKEDLIVMNRHSVKWYICGPTVYDTSHIGHGSCYVRLDIIRRILERYFNLKMIVVLGITDIDDKIIQKSNQLNIDFNTIAKKYELEFMEDLDNLNILQPTFITRVSDHIPEIIDIIQTIIKKNHAYSVKDGSVYFDSNSMNDYIKLVNISEESRLICKEEQKQPSDFTLWKAVKPNEPSWKSPWGDGRPGWHIECSAMASKILGSSLDLHSGGIDLIFPHHQCEEIQSCAFHGCKQWVNYWIHAGELKIDQAKMSKSLNNYVPISSVLQNYSSDSFRMFCLLSKYNTGVDYTEGSMKHAEAMCKKMSTFEVNCKRYLSGIVSGNVLEADLLSILDETAKNIEANLKDDFDTVESFRSVERLVDATNNMLFNNAETTISRSPAAIAQVSSFASQFFETLGFYLNAKTKERNTALNSKFDSLAEQAKNFRLQVKDMILSSNDKSLKKNFFQVSDAFRNDLRALGVDVKDSAKSQEVQNVKLA